MSEVKCKCKVTGDGFAIVCEPHYNQYMKQDMDRSLLTTESFAKKIWKKLKVKIIK